MDKITFLLRLYSFYRKPNFFIVSSLPQSVAPLFSESGLNSYQPAFCWKLGRTVFPRRQISLHTFQLEFNGLRRETFLRNVWSAHKISQLSSVQFSLVHVHVSLFQAGASLTPACRCLSIFFS